MTTTQAKLKLDNLSKGQMREILLSIINSEVSNLRLQKFINNERFGYDGENYSEKIEEISRQGESLLNWIASNDENLKFTITQNIIVEGK